MFRLRPRPQLVHEELCGRIKHLGATTRALNKAFAGAVGFFMNSFKTVSGVLTLPLYHEHEKTHSNPIDLSEVWKYLT